KGPSLYNHVASRDALVRAVALRGITELTDALTLAATGLAGEDAVLAAGRAYRDYAGAAPGRYTAGLRAPASGDEDLRAAAARALGAFHATLRGYALSEEELVHAVRAMRSALHGFVTLEAEGGFAMDVDRDRSFEAMLQMLVAGIGARVGLGG
ncbi:MAG: TetR-like C-terminal domain-containing protein, partial [Patulibacter sp.]|nr:TetR-like C-terminal domain-containing protein [Patulibacter sp.]